MADYTVIADVGNAIVSVLRENMVPDVVPNPESIGLSTLEDKGDLLVGVHLYDIRESEEYRNSGMISEDISRQKYPSIYLTLYYMVSAYSNGDVKFKASEEHKILGRALQALADNRILDGETLQPTEQGGGANIIIEMDSLSMEDKMKIWTVPNKTCPLSLFFKAGPIELESAKTRKMQRVVDIDFQVRE